MLKPSAFIFLLVSFCSLADDIGYVYEGDLNGDGVSDTIASGPHDQFGSAGGPFVIVLSQLNGTPVHKIVYLHPSAISLEHHVTGNFLWGYARHGGGTGTLFSISFDGQFKTEEITINAGPFYSDLAASISNAVFNEKFRLILKKVDSYEPPHYGWVRG